LINLDVLAQTPQKRWKYQFETKRKTPQDWTAGGALRFAPSPLPAIGGP